MKHDIFHTQDRSQLRKYIEQRERNGWKLLGPVQFQIVPGSDVWYQSNETYYLATFVKEDNPFPGLPE